MFPCRYNKDIVIFLNFNIMDQNFTETSSEPTSKNNQSWLFLGIGFLLGAVVFFFVGQNYAKPVPIKDPFAGAKYGLTGKVVLAEGNVLAVGVDATAFGLPVSAYKVYTDGRTVFKKAVYIKGSAGGLNIFELKPISVAPASLADVTLGVDVAARSKTNFGDLKEFTASEIEIRLYQ